MHRRENKNYFQALIQLILILKSKYTHLHFVWITHPNYTVSDKELQRLLPGIRVSSALQYMEFIELYKHAKFIITDSGGITEEASHLGIPIVVYRNVTDRPEPLQMNHPMLVSLDQEEIISFFNNNEHTSIEEKIYYGDGNASTRIFEWIKEKLMVYDC